MIYNSTLKPSSKPMKRCRMRASRPKMPVTVVTALGVSDRLPTTKEIQEFKAKKVPKRMKSSQRSVTAKEKTYWNRLSTEVGCIACRIDGRLNHYVSIHHVDGRTKPGCHMLVLPLCAQHHQQDDSDVLERVAVHPNKATFEMLYGPQERLMEMCREILGLAPINISE